MVKMQQKSQETGLVVKDFEFNTLQECAQHISNVTSFRVVDILDEIKHVQSFATIEWEFEIK